MEKVCRLMVDFDACLTASGVSIDNIRHEVLINVSELKIEINSAWLSLNPLKNTPMMLLSPYLVKKLRLNNDLVHTLMVFRLP